MVGPVTAGLGKAGHGKTRQGKDDLYIRITETWPGWVGPGGAGLGGAGRGQLRQGKVFMCFGFERFFRKDENQ